jgi:hypothetical protein
VAGAWLSQLPRQLANDTAREQDRRSPAGIGRERAAGRVPGPAAGLDGLLAQDHAQEIEMVDRHVGQQWVRDAVVAVALEWSMPSKVDRGCKRAAKASTGDKSGGGEDRRVEAVILAYHQHEPAQLTWRQHPRRAHRRAIWPAEATLAMVCRRQLSSAPLEIAHAAPAGGSSACHAQDRPKPAYMIMSCHR